MAGKESEDYRPRRAWSNDAEPTETPSRPSDVAESKTDVPSDPVQPDLDKLAASEVDESTAILPRTSRRTESEDLEESPRTHRGRTALLVGAVAAVVVLGLAIGYAVLTLNESSSANPLPPVTSSSSTEASPSASTPPPAVGALLTDDSMLSAKDAQSLGGDRRWKIALTQTGVDAESPQAACLGGEPAEGQPTPQQTMLRLLSSSGKDAPGVLHQADAYATPEEAAQAYVWTAKALGGCKMDSTFIDSGEIVTGVGDQSLGLVLVVKDGSATESRNVMLARSGRVVDVVDVASKDDSVSPDDVAKVLGKVVDAQCATSGGKCADKVAVRPGPPPVGGDQLGFLATADLPPVGKSTSAWIGNTPTEPEADKTYSGCETVDFAQSDAKTAMTRTYLLEDSAGLFGLDEIVLTAKDEAAAMKTVADLKKGFQTCKTRKLTASVTPLEKVTGVGAKSTQIAGWTATVTQSTSSNDKSTYRVGIASVGARVIYVYLSADVRQKLDLTDAEFATVTVRAAQRATQVR